MKSGKYILFFESTGEDVRLMLKADDEGYDQCIAWIDISLKKIHCIPNAYGFGGDGIDV